MTVRLLVLVLALLFAAGPVLAANRRRNNNQARSTQAQINAVNSANKHVKARVTRAETVVAAASKVYLALQAEAGQSLAHYQNALSDLERADSEKFGASQELAELKAKLEKFEPDDAPIKKAHREYDQAVEELAEIRADIYESDKYLSLHDSALDSPNKSEELARVQKICFDDDPEYKAAKGHVEQARKRYDEIRFALYAADPQWEPAVKRAREAAAAAGKAESSVKATAVEKGVEGINAREAAKRLAVAQAALANAKADLKRLEGRKDKLQPNKPAQTPSQKDAAKKKKKT
jgi:hypothetical protein